MDKPRSHLNELMNRQMNGGRTYGRARSEPRGANAGSLRNEGQLARSVERTAVGGRGGQTVMLPSAGARSVI